MKYEALYEKIISSLVEDGYIVIDDALESGVADALLAKAQKLPNYKKAGISKQSAKDTNRRRDAIVWLDEDGACVSEYLSFAEGLRVYLNRSLYLGLRYYEAHFAHYEAGDFYEKHLDAFQNSKNRVVTTVLYLNDEWSEADGGALAIFDKEDDFLQHVLPKKNRLVVFMSEVFPHAVEPANRDRYSIAGWFRVDK
jgi:SM-20-related protein